MHLLEYTPKHTQKTALTQEKKHSYCLKMFNPFSAGTAFMLMQTGWIQASHRVTPQLA